MIGIQSHASQKRQRLGTPIDTLHDNVNSTIPDNSVSWLGRNVTCYMIRCQAISYELKMAIIFWYFLYMRLHITHLRTYRKKVDPNNRWSRWHWQEKDLDIMSSFTFLFNTLNQGMEHQGFFTRKAEKLSRSKLKRFAQEDLNVVNCAMELNLLFSKKSLNSIMKWKGISNIESPLNHGFRQKSDQRHSSIQ